MVASVLHLEGERIVEQGSYWTMLIRYPGDMQGASLRGQIRTDFGGSLITEFRFLIPYYDPDEHITNFPVYLNAAQTAHIPIPSTHWVYDLKMSQPGEDAFRLLQGHVLVSPGVTE